MLPPDAKQRIQESLDALFAIREAPFMDALRRDTNLLVGRGLLGGSAATDKIARSAIDELAVRVQSVRAILERTVASMRIQLDDSGIKDLGEVFSRATDQQRQLVSSLIADTASRIAEGDEVKERINSAAAQQQRAQRAEMQYFIDSVRQSNNGRPSVNTTINIAGSVGVVLTGAYATAHVSMGAQEKERLVEALRALESAIAANQELTSETRENASDIAKDIVVAVDVAKPNPSKIGGLLSGLATTIQTAASLRGAWELVKDAAVAAGLIAP